MKTHSGYLEFSECVFVCMIVNILKSMLGMRGDYLLTISFYCDIF